MADAAEKWRNDLRRAHRVQDAFISVASRFAEATEPETQAKLDALDQRALVGSRHHVVPRFLLERWASDSGQVQVYRRIERTHRKNHIKDLAIKDFYTFVDVDLRKNSTLESLLGQMETSASQVLGRLHDPLQPTGQIGVDELSTLAEFAAFQAVRTPRRRREFDLQAEWTLKTLARGRISEKTLRQVEITAHQNEWIAGIGELALAMIPLIAARPVALVLLNEPLLLISDEPVVINAPGNVVHTPDCFLTDEQIAERIRRRRRRDRRRGFKPGYGERVVHFYSTMGRGAGVAIEVVVPVSPSTALVWGPLGEKLFPSSLEFARLTGAESREFAARLNSEICAQALDWIVARPDDPEFSSRDFPQPGPLVAVCDGTNAAADAINSTPRQMRPTRLWMPSESERS